MIELLIALGIFITLVLVAVGSELVDWRVLLIVGASMVGGGLTVGIVVGISYHLSLYRALAPTGLLGPRWWWHPTSYNDRIPPANRGAVMLWFYAGVISMAIVLVGCGLVLSGVLMLQNSSQMNTTPVGLADQRLSISSRGGIDNSFPAGLE